MMEIIVEKNSGFCFGVKNAVERTEKELRESKDKNIYTYGTLIHNRQVIDKLLESGLHEIHDTNFLNSLNNKDVKVIIRSHGISQDILRGIKEKGIEYVDCTCPFVSKIHNIVSDYHNEGYKVFIAGNKDHPEVIGINGWCNNEAVILEDEITVDNLPLYDKICLVAQTTITANLWSDIAHKVKDKYENVKIFNTRCNATENRQNAARELAKKVDVMLVIGGKNSSNTGKLFEISKKECNNTYHIETSDELTKEMLGSAGRVGITAGASTPDWILKEVILKMQDLNNENTNDNAVDNEDIIEKENVVEKESVFQSVNENMNEIESENISEAEGGNISEIESDNTSEIESDNISEIQSTNESEIESESTSESEGTNEIESTDENIMEEYEKSLISLSEGDTVKGTVLSLNDEEVIVNIGYKADGIITKEDLSSDTEIKPSELVEVGDEIEVKVVKINDGEGNVVLSKRLVELDKNIEKLELVYTNNLSIKGVVKEIVKGGAIVELIGVKTFMPASLFDLYYVSDLESFKNKEVHVRIIEFIKENKKIIVSRKAHLIEEKNRLQEEFWNSVEEGKRITGEVKRLTNFGAFVDIGGLDGLIHISELSWTRINHPSEVLQPGDKVEVVVLSFDKEKNKVSLGLKQTMPEPWEAIEGKYSIGDIIEVKIVRFANFGAFAELEPGIDGLIHISQISEERIAKPSQVLEINEIVNVKIIDTNIPEKKISLSIIEAKEE